MNKKIVGVISDTHGLVRPEVASVLEGCELIIHAGDVGTTAVIKKLQEIAPVVAVRGNTDKGDWANFLPLTNIIELENVLVYILHDLDQLDLDPVAAGCQVVISGHSHKPKIENKNGVIYLNPGSAGPRRFNLPVTVAKLEVENGNRIDTKIIELIPTS